MQSTHSRCHDHTRKGPSSKKAQAQARGKQQARGSQPRGKPIRPKRQAASKRIQHLVGRIFSRRRFCQPTISVTNSPSWRFLREAVRGRTGLVTSSIRHLETRRARSMTGTRFTFSAARWFRCLQVGCREAPADSSRAERPRRVRPAAASLRPGNRRSAGSAGFREVRGIPLESWCGSVVPARV